MQDISIKSGTTAKISITPKINGSTAIYEQVYGYTFYVFFVYQFTDKIYKEPYILTPDSSYNNSQRLTITLTPHDTIDMLGNASENQRFELQFAIKTVSGEIIAEEKDSNVTINIVKWEAGQWINKNE